MPGESCLVVLLLSFISLPADASVTAQTKVAAYPSNSSLLSFAHEQSNPTGLLRNRLQSERKGEVGPLFNRYVILSALIYFSHDSNYNLGDILCQGLFLYGTIATLDLLPMQRERRSPFLRE